MYKKILIAIENSDTDRLILEHVKSLASTLKSEVLLVHVADGFVARNQDIYNLHDSEEMEQDRKYLEQCSSEFQALKIVASWQLAAGEPSDELLKRATDNSCDLIAMATHGHKLLGDLIHGSVADKLRHSTSIPILMIRAHRI